MRYNIHCHVFNLQSIFTPATAFILQSRLSDSILSPEFASDIVKTLRRFIEHGGGFDSVHEDEATANDPWPSGPISKFKELRETFRLAMLRNMDMVTDDMVSQFGTDSDVVFAPLMMDILIEQQAEPVAGDVFDAQLAGTQRQILRHPGRILPFYAVNPYRANFVERTVRALTDGGFVGVKLYPSLGHSITAPGMDAVMRHCGEHGVPLLMHCNHGGFKKNDASVDFCAPRHWREYLDRYPGLRICFGHFGGEENFRGRAVLTRDSWTLEILRYMKQYPGRVFADVAYHDNALAPKSKDAYFEALGTILADPDYCSQVLFGTDTWLVRMVCRELAYWAAFYPPSLREDDLALMMGANARAFLGVDADRPGDNILNYMQYMQDHAGWTDADAGDWLRRAASPPDPR